MRVVIYTSSSFGGVYDYARQLHHAYLEHPVVESCQMIYPKNAPLPERADVHKMLMPDQLHQGAGRRDRQVQLLKRLARNPLTLLRWLAKQPPSLVLLNDFEQTSAPVWAPLYKRLAARHRFGVILHDPDRDAYPPSKEMAERCMRAMMSAMHLGLYHQHLPAKPYYAPNGKTHYLDVPHGLYPPPPPDAALSAWLRGQMKPGLRYATILGNIRKEKNYELVLEAMALHPGMGLIVAGRASHQGVDVDGYRALATKLGLADRVIWLERFLTEAEMASVIEAAEFVLLYYARTFTSQSGILNTVAPARKTIIASDGGSSLATTIHKFNIGILAEPDSVHALHLAMGRALDGFGPHPLDWGNYLEYADWANHASTVMAALERNDLIPG